MKLELQPPTANAFFWCHVCELEHMTPLQLLVVIQHKGANAQYEVLSEAAGIYEVELVNYDGRSSHAPPMRFTMLRGIVSWNGSIDDKALLHRIGEQIEVCLNRILTKEAGKTLQQS